MHTHGGVRILTRVINAGSRWRWSVGPEI